MADYRLNQRVVVTDGAGYIGFVLVISLLNRGDVATSGDSDIYHNHPSIVV